MTDRETCEWRQQDVLDNSANWDTSCGNIFVLMEGNPTDNSMKFCCYCGKELIHVTND